MGKPKKIVEVAILMGSESDFNIMKEAGAALEQFGLSYEFHVLSAHRAPEDTADFARQAQGRGMRVIIAGAGLAAHLPGVLASLTVLPVIGVPLASSSGGLGGQDALYSIVQMPKGVPVACVGVGNAWNAGVLAAQIIGAGEGRSGGLLHKVKSYREGLRKKVLSQRVK